MNAKPGLLRRLLGPESGRVFDHGARRLPRGSEAEGDDDDPSGQQFAAMIHAVWLVFATDAQLDDLEIDHLLALIGDLTDGEASIEAIEDLFGSYEQLLHEVGVAGSASLIADLLPERALRESALKLAIGAVSLDGRMSESEERVLMILASAFGYNSRQTQDFLLEVESRLAQDGS